MSAVLPTEERVPLTGEECLKPFKDGFGGLGFEFNCKFWKPELKEGERPRALVYIAHGLGEHCMRYDHVGRRLAENGYLAFAHDMTGHGKSRGEPCYIERFEYVYNEIALFVDLVRFKLPGAPVFAIGHSLGGAILLRMTMSRTCIFKGIILIGPAIISPVVTRFTKLASKFVAFFNKHAVIAKPLDPEAFCRDPKMVKSYKEDRLVYHGGLKARSIVVEMEIMENLQQNFEKISKPFLLLHGSVDTICDVSGSLQLFQRAASKDKTFTIYDGCYHQVHNEPDGDKERCLEEIAAWIEDRVGPPPAPKDCLIALTPPRDKYWDQFPARDTANSSDPRNCTDKSNLVM